jgi:hypothetical protein
MKLISLENASKLIAKSNVDVVGVVTDILPLKPTSNRGAPPRLSLRTSTVF